jgi:hypothetical protein
MINTFFFDLPLPSIFPYPIFCLFVGCRCLSSIRFDSICNGDYHKLCLSPMTVENYKCLFSWTKSKVLVHDNCKIGRVLRLLLTRTIHQNIQCREASVLFAMFTAGRGDGGLFGLHTLDFVGKCKCLTYNLVKSHKRWLTNFVWHLRMRKVVSDSLTNLAYTKVALQF